MNANVAKDMSSETAEEQLRCVNLQMLRASHMVLKTYDDAYRPYGIRATQLPVLSLVASFGPMTIKQISAETASERSVLSRKLQVMEKNGWIILDPESKGREKAFMVTEEGQALLDRVMPVRWKVQEQILGRLSPEEQNLMLTLCEKLKS
jgi:DNA-binding MarR family transcriptional regulator